jgi:AcrR family transcriptional regulator
MPKSSQTATRGYTRLENERRREDLLRVGRELFSVHPYDALSVDDIAAAAGMSRGLLYHYFESKRDFYVAVVRTAAEEMREVTEPDPDAAPLEQLRQGLTAYFDYAEHRAEGYRAVVQGGIGADREVRDIADEIRQLNAQRILDSLGAHDPRPALRLAVRGWVGLVEAVTLDWLDHHDVDRERLIAELMSALNSSLAMARSLDPKLKLELPGARR